MRCYQKQLKYFWFMGYGILYHNDLGIKEIESAYGKTLDQLREGNFRAADVRKMVNNGFYRARLNIKDRLLFTFVSYRDEKYILLLEFIKDHNYDQSRFLRGASFVDENELLPFDPPAVPDQTEAPALCYLNPDIKKIHLLNKFISFDEFQLNVFELQPPLIIIGSAGSGKTAVVLEKMKTLTGNVAYISLSKFLVENASALYYSGGYENEFQEAEFLSLEDYLASWKKPDGKEVNFRAFSAWFARHAQALRLNEPYRVYEEFKGVLTGSPTHTAYLTEMEYLGLGVKQSIFAPEERKKLYPLFLKYMEWMKEQNLYDSNRVCFDYLQVVCPRYDYLVVDEVQDITNVQLKCILQSLIKPDRFILTGDSNQIVHPNFFSWSKVKSFFHASGEIDGKIKILRTNYRNSPQVVRLSNDLLKIKNTRFGSIDKESNYLVGTVSKSDGEATLYSQDEKKMNELNKLTQNSTKFAVIVPEGHGKDFARRYFKTPLEFTVQEAKGLEYDNVILVNFVSNHDAEFKEIIHGVVPEDLAVEELKFSRNANKEDKDAEIYKFYINSFYVAITRAVTNIFLFEKNTAHPALRLLGLTETKEAIRMAETKSSKEEWLAEARKLEEQGKFEQAEQIRAKYLGYTYISQEQLEQVLAAALDPANKESEVKKERKLLFEYAVNHQRIDWIEGLAKLQFQRAMVYFREIKVLRKDFSKNIRLGNSKSVLSILDKYGNLFSDDQGANALMLSSLYGQTAILKDLLQRAVPIVSMDHRGRLSLDYLLEGYFNTALKKQQQFAILQHVKQFWHLLKPTHLAFEIAKVRFQVSGQSMLLFLVVAMRAKQASQALQLPIDVPEMPDGSGPKRNFGVFNMDDLEKLASLMPDEILPPYRKKRTYINSVMAGNEATRFAKEKSCKPVFMRAERGYYILNPALDWI